jgi:hypothetical protein
MAWKITLSAPVQDTIDPKQYVVSVTYTSDVTGNEYKDNYRMANDIDDLNRQIQQNLVSYQKKEAFLQITEGDYQLPVDQSPSLVVVPVAEQAPVDPTPVEAAPVQEVKQ